MLTKVKIVFVFLPVLFLISCSIAPLTTPKTARTLGRGHWEIDTGFSPTYFSAHRGFSKNFDVGLTIESQIGLAFELSGKYALLNRSEQGTSFAIFGGVFSGSSLRGRSSVLRLGPILSYKMNWWEPYVIVTYNRGQWEWGGLTEYSGSRMNNFIDLNDLQLDRGETFSYSYIQYSLGSNFWFTKGFAFTFNVKHLSFLGDDIKGGKGIAPAVGFIWRF